MYITSSLMCNLKNYYVDVMTDVIGYINLPVANPQH